MTSPGTEGLLEFLRRLERARIHHTVGSVRDGFTMVRVDVPGERWEVEFGDDGEIEVEVFRSNGEMLGAEALVRVVP